LTVGELIRSIQRPISIYVDEIVKAFLEKLCKDLLPVGKCKSPEDCNKKTKGGDLCKSCKCWFNKLEASHKKGNNPLWHKNCKSASWSEDHWEVAKFFMPALGSNLSSTKDAESTDISSLLNVLEWMNVGVFLGKVRVSVDLVRKLRSQVRNTWAHAPQQELGDDEKVESFSIATDFLEDLEKVFSHAENAKCLEHLKHLKTSGVTNVVESELQSLLLQRYLLDDIKEEITTMKVERSTDKSAIEEHEQKLVKLKCALSECSQRMTDFETFKENINKQFDNFAEEWKSFRAIPEDIHEIRNNIEQIRDDLAKMNERQKDEREPTTCLPDKLPMFTAREAEIQKVITFLKDEGKAVVSLHGGPGFGKTAIAIEVSHQLSEDDNILVVFSQLTTATTVDEMMRRLCLDVGVNHEDDPKPSLIFCLKNIKKKVILVMDDIDNLLEEKTRPRLYDFIRLLRKNSNCQIVTTSRSCYLIPELSIGNVDVEEMDINACLELLKKQCPHQDDTFLRRLAELCGNIPLAMCIAGSQVDDFKDPDELLQHLEKQPLKTLECSKSNQFVHRAIDSSFKILTDEQKKDFVRLAVFEESLSEEAAKVVIEKDNLDTKRILENLVSRSLIKQPTKQRYSIHLLIKHFLRDQLKGKNKRAKKARAEGSRAKVLMVEYYLNLGHDLTINSYSKDGYKANREALKQEAHNIQNVLKICCQQKDPKTSDISDCLEHSKVYTTSARFFSLFVRTIIPGSIVDEFLHRCANLAEERKQHASKINFDCLIADQERSKSIGESHECFDSKMEEIKREFDKHYEELKEDKSRCAHYHYQYGRYLLRKSEVAKGKQRSDSLHKARKQLEKSLELRRTLSDTSVGIADVVFSLQHLGNTWKKIASSSEKLLQLTMDCENAKKKSQEYYEEAIELSKEHLGEHELTSSCYKNFGDLFLTIQEHKLAEEKYTTAKRMRENLGLNASERHVFLLNNLGICLTKSKRVNQAIEILESARDMGEKLAESDEPNVCKTKVYTSLAIAYDSEGKHSDAVNYAHKALTFVKAINKEKLNKLQIIVSKNAGNN
jgi:tetratricopeptide (TPR) repeat protein